MPTLLRADMTIDPLLQSCGRHGARYACDLFSELKYGERRDTANCILLTQGLLLVSVYFDESRA